MTAIHSLILYTFLTGERVVSHIYVKGLGDLSLLVQLLLHVKLYHTCVHCQYIVGVFLLYAKLRKIKTATYIASAPMTPMLVDHCFYMTGGGVMLGRPRKNFTGREGGAYFKVVCTPAQLVIVLMTSVYIEAHSGIILHCIIYPHGVRHSFMHIFTCHESCACLITAPVLSPERD